MILAKFNWILLLILILLLPGNKVLADQITVATIRELVPIISDIKKYYEKEHPEDFINILPFKEEELEKELYQESTIIDIAILDDLTTLEKFADKALITKNTIQKLAGDKLCIIVKKNVVMRPFLLYPETSVTKAIIVSNPYQTALGRYTKEALTKLKLWQKLSKKLVFFENYLTIANTVSRGHYDGGIIYCSAAKHSFVEITDILNPELHHPIIYASGVTTAASKKTSAMRFNRFLNATSSRKVYKEYNLLP
jgi:molybdate transport system substrate-binding protein